MSFPGASVVKNPTAMQEMQECAFDPSVVKIPWRTKCLPTPVFVSRESPGQRSLVGYSPWGHKELDMSDWARTCAHTHTHTRQCRSDSMNSRYRLTLLSCCLSRGVEETRAFTRLWKRFAWKMASMPPGLLRELIWMKPSHSPSTNRLIPFLGAFLGKGIHLAPLWTNILRMPGPESHLQEFVLGIWKGPE